MARRWKRLADVYILVENFGDERKREEEKMLERRADEHSDLALLQRTVENWLDFFAYTQFIDRDGKYHPDDVDIGFEPLSLSMKRCSEE